MGGDGDIKDICRILFYIKYNFPNYKLCWYSGKNYNFIVKKTTFSKIISKLDYIKTGPYIKKFGGLDNPNTNQRFYKIEKKDNVSLLFDITKVFYENKNLYKEDK